LNPNTKEGLYEKKPHSFNGLPLVFSKKSTSTRTKRNLFRPDRPESKRAEEKTEGILEGLYLQEFGNKQRAG
jgi:hypothetical protein